MVEQGTENPCVGGPIPSPGTIFCVEVTMKFESREEYLAFKEWEYKTAMKKLCQKNHCIMHKKKSPTIPVFAHQKRRIAYIRSVFLDKDADSRLSRSEMNTILKQTCHKMDLEKKDTIPFLVRKARDIVRSR